MTSPTLPPLIVELADVARRAGLDVTAPGVVQAVEDAIRDATVDAESYLGRSLIPVQHTEQHVTPTFERWLFEPDPAHEWLLQHDPVVAVAAVVPEIADGLPTGLYTVTYTAGLDARGPEFARVRRWVTAAACVHPQVRRLQAQSMREVRSVAAEGQSVTYAPGPTAAEVPTSGVPPQATMDLWRRAGRDAYT